MADLDIGTVVAGFEIKSKGVKELVSELNAADKVQEQVNARFQAAQAIFSQAEQTVVKLAGSYAKAKLEATQGTIAIQKHTAAVEQNKRALAAMETSGEKAGETYKQVSDELEANEAALTSAEAEYGEIIDAVEEYDDSLHEMATAQKQATAGERAIGQAYGSNVWQIRSYSRGLADFVNIVGAGGGTLSQYEGILSGAVYTTAEFANAAALAQKNNLGWSGALEGLKTRLSGVGGVTAIMTLAVAGATIAIRALANRQKEEKQGAEQLTKILLGETEAIEANTEAWIRNDLAQKHDLETALEIGASSETLRQLFEQGEDAVKAYTEAIAENMRVRIRAGEDSGSEWMAEQNDLIKRIQSEWRQYSQAQESAATQSEDAWASAASNIVQDLAGIEAAVRRGGDANNFYRDSIYDIMRAELAQKSAAGSAVDMLLRLAEAQKELGVARRTGTLEERRALESEILSLQTQLEGAFQTAMEEGFDLTGAIEEMMQRAADQGMVLTEADILSILPKAQDFEDGTSARAGEITTLFIGQLFSAIAASTGDPALNQKIAIEAKALGISVVGGIINGTSGLSTSLFNKIDDEINAALKQVKLQTLNSRSPSQVWAELVGLPIGQGITEGAIEGLADLALELDDALSAARAAVSFQQSQLGLGRANEGLVAAERDLENMMELRDAMGGDTMRVEDQIAIRNAERALALTRAAAAAGLATQADVILAEQKLALAREEAMTYNEAVLEMERGVEEANLAVQAAQLSVMSAFLNMLEAAQRTGEGSIDAFVAFATALGMPLEMINAIVASMRQAQEIAGQFPALGGNTGGGPGGPPSPPPYVGPPAIGGGGGGLYMQHGGRFTGRSPIIVGEKGPELLVPKLPGEVFTNRELGDLMRGLNGGGSRSVYIGQITVPVQWPIDDLERRKIVRQIREEIRQLDGEY